MEKTITITCKFDSYYFDESLRKALVAEVADVLWIHSGIKDIPVQVEFDEPTDDEYAEQEE